MSGLRPIPHHQLHPGDVLRWQCPNHPENVHRWRVFGVHLGGKAHDGRWTESLIECESLTHVPGWTGPLEFHPRIFIPECLTRTLTIEDVGEQFGVLSGRRAST